jgi:hypothetical protein
MKIKIFFAWYDFWIGFYWSSNTNTLYFCPIPMITISFRFKMKSCEGVEFTGTDGSIRKIKK